VIGTGTLEQRVRSALGSAFAVDESTIHPGLELRDELGADSLALMELLATFEDELGVELPEDAGFVAAITTVGDMVRALRVAGAR
jgi:acyl carrier protein